MRLQPAHLYEAAAHHEEGHQVGQHKVGQIVAESGFLVKVFLKTRPKPAFGRQGLDWDRWARIQFSQVHFGAFCH